MIYGRTPTRGEREWMSKAVQLGCICCIKDKAIKPFEVSHEHTAMHHINGKTKQDAHFETIPLCPGHHQHAPFAIHRNKSEFERRCGKQMDLLKHVRRLVNETGGKG